jgi:hypothetical protein
MYYSCSSLKLVTGLITLLARHGSHYADRFEWPRSYRRDDAGLPCLDTSTLQIVPVCLHVEARPKGTCIRCRQTVRTPQEVEPDPVPVDAILPLGHILSRGSLITAKRNFSPIYSREGLIVERRTGIELRKAMLNTVFVRRMERRV